MSATGVILFYTTSAVFRAEKLLQRQEIAVTLIPTPRTLSSDCGTALQFPWEQRSRVESALAGARLEYAGIHATP